MKYLSPLIMAYDDRLKEKSDVIRAYEVRMMTLLISTVIIASTCMKLGSVLPNFHHSVIT